MRGHLPGNHHLARKLYGSRFARPFIRMLFESVGMVLSSCLALCFFFFSLFFSVLSVFLCFFFVFFSLFASFVLILLLLLFFFSFCAFEVSGCFCTATSSAVQDRKLDPPFS